MATWLFPLIVIEVDPAEFDSPDAERLLSRLESRYAGVNVSMITPDWEAEGGFRVAGLEAPLDILAAPDLEWRELILCDEEELPF